jgi:hypothetical protein
VTGIAPALEKSCPNFKIIEKKGKMKTKQSIIAVVTVIMAMAAITGCKKDTTLVPEKSHQLIKLESAPDSAGLSGDDDGPKHPHTP